ncbi:MAG: TIGR04282 family arsenosugar biosynthesis glycosyltransferase, partial [Desulfamplus sp.]|nr:TIGR04282 family arsenosugar biosynthesis glycosyltransferase [Desulfamplus sp.]
MKNECLIFYVKLPKEGHVKTRLAKDIGNEHAVNLYRHFILDLVETLKKLSQDVIISYSPQDAEPFFRSWLGKMFDSRLGKISDPRLQDKLSSSQEKNLEIFGDNRFHYVPQSDGDLGVRMRHSFEQAFRNGYKRAVLIGSDSPDLPKEILEEAFVQLKSSDAVIGPSTDGGYWLIGFNSKGFCPSMFEQISWSTQTVFEETMKKLSQTKSSVALLPEWIDIDNYDALVRWYESKKSLSKNGSYTLSYMFVQSKLLK